MPSYFFHLLFELYPPESEYLRGVSTEQLGLDPFVVYLTASTIGTTQKQVTKAVKGEAVKKKKEPPGLGLPCFRPPPGFDIFGDGELLIDHGEIPLNWDSLGRPKEGGTGGSGEGEGDVKRKTKYQDQRHIDFRFGRVVVEGVDFVAAPSGGSAGSGVQHSLQQKQQHHQQHQQVSSTGSTISRKQNHITNNLLKSKQTQTATGAAVPSFIPSIQNTVPSPISTSTIMTNLPPSNNNDTASRGGTGVAEGTANPSITAQRSRIGTIIAPPKARFIPLQTKRTEFGFGVVHLYRDSEETPGIYPVPDVYTSQGRGTSGSMDMHASAARSKPAGPSTLLKNDGDSEGEDEEALLTVAVLAVPSYMTASDFMGFVGEETRENVSHFRMVRTGKANRYMVLIRFRTKQGARAFVRGFNGKVFNSMEPENCHVVFVKSIQFTSPALDNSSSSSVSITATSTSTAFPSVLTNDPLTPGLPPPHKSLSTKPIPPPTPSLLELPTCPVCLERMDETTGLLTILCQHVFHCACLSKWRDNSCPVCRYTQGGMKIGRSRTNHPNISSETTAPHQSEEDREECCIVCGVDYNLWICLICGHIGCGRYDDAHAFQHFKETSHSYAMDVDTQRVWDYAGDGYVHRLIQNKSDGKLVELPSALSNNTSNHQDPNHPAPDYVPKEKLDNIGMEYTYLLTTQLDSQRTYYEEKIAQASDKARQATLENEKLTSLTTSLQSTLSTLKAQYDELTTSTLPSLEKSRDRAEKSAEKWREMARKMEKEWKEEKAVSGSLMEKVEWLKGESEKGKKELEELREQVRDLMFFLEARDKLKSHVEEGTEGIVEGVVSVPEVQADKDKGKKGKGKGRGKGKRGGG